MLFPNFLDDEKAKLWMIFFHLYFTHKILATLQGPGISASDFKIQK